jgi:hypothetical protein
MGTLLHLLNHTTPPEPNPKLLYQNFKWLVAANKRFREDCIISKGRVKACCILTL